MNIVRLNLLVIFVFAGMLCIAAKPRETVIIQLPVSSAARINYGADKLRESLTKLGYRVQIRQEKAAMVNSRVAEASKKIFHIFLTDKEAASAERVRTTGLSAATVLKKEGFHISGRNNIIFVQGKDASGVLYGCLELARQAAKAGKLPANPDYTDAPEMVLRGECIGLQKPYYLPGRNVYEYPYTPETFPWFYNKKLWLQVLDSMVQNRMNSLYLWNGHPFASLVKLKDYPYAVEVDDAIFRKNEEIFRFLTTEADRRGIWVIQMFYNIIISKPFAEKNGLKTQERERPIIPIIADYTRKSIAAFVEKYPNVGLLVTLGEAMEGVGRDDIDWFTKTIIPGVQDGMKALGVREEPPIVLRAHDTDAPSVMKEALPFYKNLYTMAKFNGEALTYETPRGKWADLHRTLSSQGNVHIANVHILANLEPFRYGSPGFIQRSVIGMHEALGANGLHLYPEASYWDWPYSADSIKDGSRLLQIERDWLWYKAWSRYAWKAKRNDVDEKDFWSQVLGDKFGMSAEQGRQLLTAYEESGEIAPKLLRRFGITDGNRQTLTLGMLMTQLINPYRYGLFTLLYESEAPAGEPLAEYAEKDWKGLPHQGETPVQVNREVKLHGDKAVAAVDAIAKYVTKEKAEFERIRNDMHCYKALAYHYALKTEAALNVLQYKYSENITDLEKALPLLHKSLDYYHQLVNLTRGTYLYANSMQTQQRKIPLRGVNGTFKTWAEVYIPFRDELRHFERSLDSIKNKSTSIFKKSGPLKNVNVIISGQPEIFVMDSLAKVFTDTSFAIRFFAPELKGLKAIRLSF